MTILLRFHEGSFPVTYKRQSLTVGIVSWSSGSNDLSAPASFLFPKPQVGRVVLERQQLRMSN